MIDYHFTKVICSIWNASQFHRQMSLEALSHTLCSDSILLHGTETLTIVIHSPLTQKTSIKGCLLVFTLFIYGLSPLRSRLFFRPSSYNQGDLIHFSSRCSGDKVPVYHIYLQLSMFNAQYNWNQMVYCCS